MIKNISKTNIIFILIFLILVFLSIIYSHDGRSYDGPLIKGYPFPYYVETAGMLCLNFDEISQKCLDDRTTFYPFLLIVNIILCLCATIFIRFIYFKLKK